MSKYDAVYNINLLDSKSQLPTDRIGLNYWARSFYNLNPYINNIINNHCSLISSLFELEHCSDKIINLFFDKQFEALDIKNKLYEIIQDYLVLGESFVYLEFDQASGMWSKLMLQNPDYIIVKKLITGNSEIYLRPDENLRRICLSKDECDIEQTKQLNKTLVDNIKDGYNILLDNFHVSHLVMKSSPYDIRGTSLLLPLFNNLKAETATSEMIRGLLFDPTYTSTGKVRKNMIIQKYSSICNMLINWMNNKIISPICKIQGFKEFPKATIKINNLKKLL